MICAKENFHTGTGSHPAFSCCWNFQVNTAGGISVLVILELIDVLLLVASLFFFFVFYCVIFSMVTWGKAITVKKNQTVFCNFIQSNFLLSLAEVWTCDRHFFPPRGGNNAVPVKWRNLFSRKHKYSNNSLGKLRYNLIYVSPILRIGL